MSKLLSVIAEVGPGYRRKKPARGKIRPLGCRELRAPTWRSLTSLYTARPPQRAARIGALINFIGSSCTAVSVFVQWRPANSAVSLSRRVKSDYQIFFHLIIARAVLSEIRAGQSEAS